MEEAGHHTESKIQLALVRDARDKIINTTAGNYMELDSTIAGGPLGAQSNYYKFEFHGSQYFELFEQQRQVLKLQLQGGAMQNFGTSTSVPFYDAFYLGGPDDLRGYQYRYVSPRDVYGEPIGGKTYGEFTAEYSMDIVDPVRVAIFYDAGFVNAGAFNFSPYDYNDDFGLGIRLFVMGAPLHLDYGIPIRGSSVYNNKTGNQFNFSFGTRF